MGSPQLSRVILVPGGVWVLSWAEQVQAVLSELHRLNGG